MVTIDHLVVTVEVQGDSESDEAAFAKLFNKYIELWQREITLAALQQERSNKERSLGDKSWDYSGGPR